MFELNRRSLALVAAAALAAGDAHAKPRLDLQSKRGRLTALRRIRYVGDDRLFFWWLKGVRYGQRDNALTPLFAVNVLSILRLRSDGEDAFTPSSLELVVNSDRESGQALSVWRNPYTGEAIPVRSIPVGPVRQPHTIDGYRPPETLGGAKLNARSSFGPFEVVGDDVWMNGDSTAEVTQPDGGAPFRVNDLATYHASRRDLEAMSRPFVPATVSFEAVTGWQRWMGMKGMPGGCFVRAAGRKIQRLEDAPTDLLALMQAAHPAILADPAAALDKPEFRFDR